MSIVVTGKELSDVRSQVAGVRFDLAELKTGLNKEVSELKTRLTLTESLVKSLQKEVSDLKTKVAIETDEVGKVAIGVSRLTARVDGLAASLTQLATNFIPPTAITPVNREQLYTDIPMLNPVKTGSYVMKYLKTCFLDGIEGVHLVQGRIHADLNHPQIAENLPLQLSPLLAKCVLRRARVLRRPDKEDLRIIGWNKLPTYGVVFESDMSQNDARV